MFVFVSLVTGKLERVVMYNRAKFRIQELEDSGKIDEQFKKKGGIQINREGDLKQSGSGQKVRLLQWNGYEDWCFILLEYLQTSKRSFIKPILNWVGAGDLKLCGF